MNPLSARRLFRGCLGAVAVIGLWLGLSWHSNSVFFPPLRDMAGDAADYWLSAPGLRDIGSTLGNLAGGLILGIAAGTVAGLTIGQQPWLQRASTPLIEFVRAIPSVALLPAAVSLFGIGSAMKIASIALSIMWPVLINVVDGLHNLPAQWLDTARVLQLRAWQRQWWVIVPALLPRLYAGISVAVPLSLVVAVTSEMIGTTAGIGSVVLNAQYTFDVRRMWSGVLLLGVLGAALSMALTAVGRVVEKRSGAR
ncbi:ABC transporter permease [Chitinasiproducens palmae]|uniref:ABC-type nitrate/sulfonate/bicarbonate transport system, permease component n=1 Tax=Chitinasiproducens palmae TaxID=1770053 RepID=A0A1H2PU42_9BURK|nr:ABC transporter permease subunit [Chitinasiproducens palmae]SDV50691.1 ABC-type nitrate/sulfonate/bicarbonate transport system, permease component [Chitinasiproducens palmae]